MNVITPRRVFQVLLIVVVFIILMTWWFERIPEGNSNIHIQNKLKITEEQLKDCRYQQEKDFKEFAEAKPEIPVSHKKYSFTGSKIVHLDLKGAPPRMAYLLKLLPVFKNMGATGILIEYEDMFPFNGYIRLLSSLNAYSYDEIASLLSTAKSLNMEVIPLVQTLGHFEFVLKHPNFKHLRETKEYPNMPCPLHEETQVLVKKIIKQVLHLHPDIERIHLGGDEVFNMKDCTKCKNSQKSKEHLFLHHMIPLLNFVKTETEGHIKPIIWDDMIRSWSVEDMKQIAPLADIMVWGYVPRLDTFFPKDMWSKYEKAFDSIWVASSFKGALAPNTNLVPIMMHIKNHLSWINIIKEIKNKVIGVALTGWARYDHFAALCELLPAALPSLGLSLSVLKGQYKSRGKDIVDVLLGFTSPIVIDKDLFGSWDTTIPNFPGGDVYSLVAELENHISWYLKAKDRMDSWNNDRQIKEKKISFFQLNGARKLIKHLVVPSFHNFRKKCLNVFNPYFFEDAIKEWVQDKVDTYIALSVELETRLNKVKSGSEL